ncbi:hypothetical protein [Streptomyces sp. NPDC049813]|uniref:hypothetical protein n=1 Tax=Streptomyces sp. NPDC049813 TaxID=3365597 RepID=UPI00378EC1B0
MYLVHIRGLTAAATSNPERLRALVRCCARPGEHVEHISVHLGAGPLILGLFICAASAVEAQAVSRAVVVRAVDLDVFLRCPDVLRCSVVGWPDLVSRFDEVPDGRGRSVQRPDQDGGGR